MLRAPLTSYARQPYAQLGTAELFSANKHQNPHLDHPLSKDAKKVLNGEDFEKLNNVHLQRMADTKLRRDANGLQRVNSDFLIMW
jgi:hypothetical protein